MGISINHLIYFELWIIIFSWASLPQTKLFFALLSQPPVRKLSRKPAAQGGKKSTGKRKQGGAGFWLIPNIGTVLPRSLSFLCL